MQKPTHCTILYLNIYTNFCNIDPISFYEFLFLSLSLIFSKIFFFFSSSVQHPASSILSKYHQVSFSRVHVQLTAVQSAGASVCSGSTKKIESKPTIKRRLCCGWGHVTVCKVAVYRQPIPLVSSCALCTRVNRSH